jgi:hypothetical protein
VTSGQCKKKGAAEYMGRFVASVFQQRYGNNVVTMLYTNIQIPNPFFLSRIAENSSELGVEREIGVNQQAWSRMVKSSQLCRAGYDVPVRYCHPTLSK